jgi:cytochrome c551/c552
MWKIALSVLFLTMAKNVIAQNGETIFNSLHCGVCHKPSSSSIGPSLKEISNAYQNEDDLIKYLTGETKPITKTQTEMMDPYLKKTKSLSGAEKKALVDFILTQKDRF